MGLLSTTRALPLPGLTDQLYFPHALIESLFAVHLMFNDLGWTLFQRSLGLLHLAVKIGYCFWCMHSACAYINLGGEYKRSLKLARFKRDWQVSGSTTSHKIMHYSLANFVSENWELLYGYGSLTNLLCNQYIKNSTRTWLDQTQIWVV